MSDDDHDPFLHDPHLFEKMVTELQSGPCVVCGGTNYPLSVGGPTICPHCVISLPKETSPYRRGSTPTTDREFQVWENGRRQGHREAGWRPIETAPKDGTEIVAWTASGAAWIVSWEGSGWRIKSPPGRDPILYIDAVRWMPLPEPPGGGEAP